MMASFVIDIVVLSVVGMSRVAMIPVTSSNSEP